MTSYGTRYEDHGGLLTRVVDRTGCVHATLSWRGDQLSALEVPGAVVRGEQLVDSLLGPAHAIEHAGERVTNMSAIDWARPTQIPVIAAPMRIPAGAAAPIMNVIALLAARTGVPALRYAGSYPTHALWRTLLRSFQSTATEVQFTADALGRATRVARDEIAIDFVPAPHERVAIDRGHAELRDGIERVVINGISYVPDGSAARLVSDGSEHRAEVWFADTRHAHVATLAPDGVLLEGPHPLRAYASDVIGRAFPPALRAALAELVSEAVPQLLAPAARIIVTARPIRWADLGARAATYDDGGFAVHAALWDRIAPLGLARLALALAEALAPVVAAAITAEWQLMSV
ncbi:MAG: hypothetical protein H0T42_24585 [Deltaproteobacteria bacterium]|nr:hypothetical protein [Deltaproteobacteria bacterium]